MFSPRRRILILKHAEDSSHKDHHLIFALSKKLGLRYKVTFVKGLSHELPLADMVILHIDRTIVPDEYVQAVVSYPLVINRSVKNISKRLYSELMLSESSDYSGHVIVKTDANYGGRNEPRTQPDNDSAQENPDWESREYLDDYPVFDNPGEVPKGVWKNPKLIVEKFVPEVDKEGNYLLRLWVFFGDQEIHYVNYSGEKVIKSWNKNGLKMIPNEEIPMKLREIRKKMGMDYGKFDYVMHQGMPVLYDINSTPGGGRIKLNNPRTRKNIATLTNGIKNFFKKSV